MQGLCLMGYLATETMQYFMQVRERKLWNCWCK